jgi:hypothetical protein
LTLLTATRVRLDPDPEATRRGYGSSPLGP